LFNRHRQSGVAWTNHYGWQVPASFAAGDEAAFVRESVGLADLSWMLKFDLKGYGLRNPPALGEVAFSWVLGPLHCLVTCEPVARDGVMKRLESLQVAGSDLALPPPIYVTDVTSVFAQFLLAGPRCRQVLGKLTSLNLSESSLPNLSCGQSSLAHVRAIILRKDLDSVPAYHLLVSREYGESVWDSVLHAGHEFHLSPFGLQTQQLLKV
jgi:glycine cleavage system aminomethyltransferase T